MNDLRTHKIKYVDKVETNDVNYKIGSSMKIKINKDSSAVESNIALNKDIQFKVGMKIKHREEGILGEIKFIGQEKIAIVWEDNTRERIDLNEAKTILDYVDDIQTIVAPLETEMNDKTNEEEKTSVVVDKALEALGEDFIDESIEKIDVEKVKMQREINELQNKLSGKKANAMKEKIAKDVVDMAILKAVIDEDDRDLEMAKVLSFDDNQFEEYKNSILEYQNDGNEVTSSSAPQQPQLTEAERMLQKIKNGGGKGIIGDFSKEAAAPVRTGQEARTITNTASSTIERRTLADIKDTKYTFATKDSLPPSFEDMVADNLVEQLNNVQQKRQPIIANVEKELPGFENIQGLKTPIRIASTNAASFPSNTNMKDLIGSLDWTILPGKR